MNRFILALLALLAGLVAPVAPANARMNGNGSTEIGTVERIGTAVRACSAPVASAEQPACRVARRDRRADRRPVRSRVFIPSVLFGPDRALE